MTLQTEGYKFIIFLTNCVFHFETGDMFTSIRMTQYSLIIMLYKECK